MLVEAPYIYLLPLGIEAILIAAKNNKHIVELTHNMIEGEHHVLEALSKL